MFIVAVNIIAFLCSSVDVFWDNFYWGFYAIEAISVIVFTLEFFVRLYVCNERKSLRKRGPFWGRVFYCLRILTILDILSFLPFWPLVIYPFWTEFIDRNILIIFRIIRLVALAKLDRYSNGLRIFLHTIIRKRSALISAFLLSFSVMILTASFLYFTESYNPRGSPYPSIPSAIFMSIMMLTQMDYPTNESYWTGFVTMFTSIVALYLFAVPVVVLSEGFKEVGKEYLSEASNVADGSESDTTDEDENPPDGFEYMKKKFGTPMWCPHCEHCRRCLIALENNSYHREYQEIAKTLPKEVVSFIPFTPLDTETEN